MLGRTDVIKNEVLEPITFIIIILKRNYVVHLLNNVLFAKPLFSLPVGCSNVPNKLNAF